MIHALSTHDITTLITLCLTLGAVLGGIVGFFIGIGKGHELGWRHGQTAGVRACAEVIEGLNEPQCTCLNTHSSAACPVHGVR